MIAGCLNTNDGNVRILKEESSDRLQTVKLDVTSRTDLDNVKNWMRENINGGELAGFGVQLQGLFLQTDRYFGCLIGLQIYDLPRSL